MGRARGKELLLPSRPRLFFRALSIFHAPTRQASLFVIRLLFFEPSRKVFSGDWRFPPRTSYHPDLSKSVRILFPFLVEKHVFKGNFHTDFVRNRRTNSSNNNTLYLEWVARNS